MTVKELIAALQNYPPDLRVIVLGYEDGYDDVTLVKQITIMPEEKPVWYKDRYDAAPRKKSRSGRTGSASLWAK